MAVSLGGQNTVKRIFSLLFALLLVAVTAAAQDANQNWVQCRVLQFKLNRLYFDVGEESLVFAGHRAVVMKKKDTLWSGAIEKAYEGMSISEKLDMPINLKSISAHVQAATVDSHAVIRIGTTLSRSALAMLSVGKLDSISTVTHGLVDSIIIENYDDPQSMEIDFEEGKLDGILTYRADGPVSAGTRVESAWAPYMAAIVPYGRSIYRGLPVTQPLMTLFDTTVARGQFDGTDIRFESTLVALNMPSSWPAFNPAKGRMMLRPTVERGLPLKIFAPDPELRKIAGYFADLLAREQVKSDLVNRLEGCDFSLKIIPAGQHRDSTLRALLGLLGPSNIGDSKIAGDIDDLWRALRFFEWKVDADQTVWEWPDAEIILTNELSSYSLFRPRIYFVSHQSIRGSLFNADGTMYPLGLMRVRLIGGEVGR